jgi:hypothetical protein
MGVVVGMRRAMEVRGSQQQQQKLLGRQQEGEKQEPSGGRQLVAGRERLAVENLYCTALYPVE